MIAAMPSLLAPDALLPSGWARSVLLEWDEHGMLVRVDPGHDGRGIERAAGPVLPGMTNVHSHAFQRAMAGLAEFRGHPTDDFWTWREEMYRLVGLVTPEDIEAIARQLYIEMLKHGYTAVAEFHYHTTIQKLICSPGKTYSRAHISAESRKFFRRFQTRENADGYWRFRVVHRLFTGAFW